MSHRYLLPFALIFSNLLSVSCAQRPDSPLKAREVTRRGSEQQVTEARNDFLEGQLKIYKRVRDIPENCRYAYAGADMHKALYMSDPGQEFQVTDVVLDANLPRTRLIFAGSNSRTCFFYFEQGGWAHNYHLEIFHLSPSATLAYHGVGIEKSDSLYKDLDALRKAATKGAFLQPDIYP